MSSLLEDRWSHCYPASALALVILPALCLVLPYSGGAFQNLLLAVQEGMQKALDL